MATSGHDEAPNSFVNPQSLKQGHEPDTVNYRAILYVPVVLVIGFFLTFLTVTKILEYAREPSTKPLGLAGEQQTGATLNNRLARIDSNPDVKPKPPYKQPRLEGLQINNTDDPVQYKSYLPDEKGNSPHFHPEDLRPSSEHGKALGLQDYKWVDESKGIVRLPIEVAIKLALSAKDSRGKPLIVSKKDKSPVASPKEPPQQSPKGGEK